MSDESPASDQDAKAPSFANRVRVWGSWIVIIASVIVITRALPISPAVDALKEWVASAGIWGPVVFAAVYVVASVLLIPASLLTLAAGTVFGLGIGLVTVSVASTTAAAVAFLISRYLARNKVESKLKGNKKFKAIDSAVSEGGWKIVAMLRLSPAVPFTLQNYLLGITGVGFRALRRGELGRDAAGHAAVRLPGGGGGQSRRRRGDERRPVGAVGGGACGHDRAQYLPHQACAEETEGTNRPRGRRRRRGGRRSVGFGARKEGFKVEAADRGAGVCRGGRGGRAGQRRAVGDLRTAAGHFGGNLQVGPRRTENGSLGVRRPARELRGRRGARRLRRSRR